MPEPVKTFTTYEQQVDLLVTRGIVVDDKGKAAEQLQRISYFRLSGYSYPFRQFDKGRNRTNRFFPGTKLSDVIGLYDFDARLRTATLNAFAPVEVGLRALLGHALGGVHECAHLNPPMLSTRAQGGEYGTWIRRYNESLGRSSEDFVSHHRSRYGGTLPVWAAVELLDLGGLRYLFGFSKESERSAVAGTFGLTTPQLESWIKSLEIVRNAAAHQGRLYNRVYTKQPRLPPLGDFPALDEARAHMTRTFGQLTLIQHMRHSMGIGASPVLTAVLASFPTVNAVPLRHMGVPDNWQSSHLWPKPRA